MAYRTKLHVGDYQLSFQSVGNGQPAVVFEGGIAGDAASLANLARQVQTFTRVAIYDRAGLGQSDPAPRPRTVHDVVTDLHRLLHTAHVPGPYLLVGHSLGGLIARLYAHRYPHEVVALVLLDVAHPDQWLRTLQCLPVPSPHEPAALTDCRNTMTMEWTDPCCNREGLDIAASAAQVRATGHLGRLPLVVITAGKDEWDDDFPDELARALEDDWMRMQQELVALSTNSMHIIAAESTHAIQECQPDLVIDVIRSLVRDIRR